MTLVEDPILAVIGVHSSSEGYPNVKYRIEDLSSFYGDQMVHIQHRSTDHFYSGKTPAHRKLMRAFRFGYAHIKAMMSLIRYRNAQTIYIPYPSVFIAASMSMLPQRMRPKTVVVDAFISLYDTAANDRKVVKKGSMLARVLYYLELQAFRNASLVITDTVANSRYYQQLFSLDAEKFNAIPLSTKETLPRSTADRTDNSVLELLFVGTLVPLHGIQEILTAMVHLLNYPVRLTIIGDGQTADAVESHLKDYPDSVNWIRDWQSTDAIIEAIAGADVCLGIFGSSEKAKRVCPFKIYLYTSLGKPVITDQSEWTDDNPDTRESMMLIKGQNKPRLIADAILTLLDTPDTRENLGRNSRQFYEKHLSNRKALAQLNTIIDGPKAGHGYGADNR